jgi:hypothetical protein
LSTDRCIGFEVYILEKLKTTQLENYIFRVIREGKIKCCKGYKASIVVLGTKLITVMTLKAKKLFKTGATGYVLCRETTVPEF